MSADKKEPFNKLSTKDRLRYQNEMKAFHNKKVDSLADSKKQEKKAANGKTATKGRKSQKEESEGEEESEEEVEDDDEVEDE